jgi:exodeoxyribonuclease V gamma subunit
MQPYRGSVTLGEVTVEGSVLADPHEAHLARVTASRVKGKHRLRAFAELVFLTALEPDVAWESFLLGRRPSGQGHVAVTIDPLGETATERRDKAHELLAELVALYTEGHQQPIPLPCETAYTWQRELGKSRNSARYRASQVWETDRFSPEANDAAHVLLLDGILPFDHLLDAGFEEHCPRLWAPIIARSREKSL